MLKIGTVSEKFGLKLRAHWEYYEIDLRLFNKSLSKQQEYYSIVE